jgi:hypothetical protein
VKTFFLEKRQSPPCATKIFCAFAAPLSGQIPDLYACAELKVFWFFSSEKNILELQ